MKVFGYPTFDSNGEMILTTYENEYSHMKMDIRVYKLKAGERKKFGTDFEEVAVLLLKGKGCFLIEGKRYSISRKSVFLEGPYAAHIAKDNEIEVMAESEMEILVQKTKNDKRFSSKVYTPKDIVWVYSSKGKFGNVANRRVNTIFDYDKEPDSNMVLGEVLNDPGNWSGYLPHRHKQPECYYFLFDHPEGFGASFVGDQVFKSVNHSFSAIPGGELHPQVTAPGYQMYTCWMIRHLDGNPWLQTDRCEDEAFTWLHDSYYDETTNSFQKGE